MKNIFLKNTSNVYRVVQWVFFAWFIFILFPVIFQLGEDQLFIFRMQCELFCHQKLNRFIEVNTFFPLVCSRCLGIYSSLFAFSFLNFKRLRKYAYYFFIPALLDKFLEHLTSFPVGNEIRFVTGLCIGIGFLTLIQKKML